MFEFGGKKGLGFGKFLFLLFVFCGSGGIYGLLLSDGVDGSVVGWLVV